MCVKDCQYIDAEMPICKADKRLRNCNTSICCSFCSSLEFCDRVCGKLLIKYEDNVEKIIENLKIIEIELPLKENILNSLLEELEKYEYSGIFIISGENENNFLSIFRKYFPYNGIVLNIGENNIIDDLVINYIKEQDIILNDIKRKEPCFEPFRFIKINNDKTLSPCNNSCYKFGDLSFQSLEEILISKDFKDFKKKIISGDYNNLKCLYCNLLENKYNRYIEKFYNY